jgi:hypothetical protein
MKRPYVPDGGKTSVTRDTFDYIEETNAGSQNRVILNPGLGVGLSSPLYKTCLLRKHGK